jgi:hypothetical protein
MNILAATLTLGGLVGGATLGAAGGLAYAFKRDGASLIDFGSSYSDRVIKRDVSIGAVAGLALGSMAGLWASGASLSDIFSTSSTPSDFTKDCLNNAPQGTQVQITRSKDGAMTCTFGNP